MAIQQIDINALARTERGKGDGVVGEVQRKPGHPRSTAPYLIVSAIGVSTDEYVESATPVECVGPRTAR